MRVLMLKRWCTAQINGLSVAFENANMKNLFRMIIDKLIHVYICRMINIVIADDNFLVRAGLRSVLTQCEDFQVVAEVTCDAELNDALAVFTADVVMMDYTSPGFTLNNVYRWVKRSPHLKWVAITGNENGAVMVGALRGGFQSYIRKDCDFHEIIDSIKETHHGARFFCGKVLDQIRRENINVADLQILEADCNAVVISDRELEVIRYIAEGYTNGEIAERLFLSQHTVNTHRKNIMQKLGVNNTAAIVMYAVKTKLVSPNKFLFSTDSVVV
jgi:DNA-binding NarL/FixJ family response regulator